MYCEHNQSEPYLYKFEYIDYYNCFHTLSLNMGVLYDKIHDDESVWESNFVNDPYATGLDQSRKAYAAARVGNSR